MKDPFGRSIEYLRVSVTDRCNLRCGYCMPQEDMPMLPHTEILQYEEIERLVGIMAGLGVKRVRLTGGEPLMRKDIERVAAGIKRVKGIEFLGLTTNAVLLADKAETLLEAGIDGVNISLDTTSLERYELFTRRNTFAQAMQGLQKALSLPFASVKINCVLSPQSLPADWLGVIKLAQTLPADVRLIEWMPMTTDTQGAAVQAPEALRTIEEHFGTLTPAKQTAPAGPAEYWTLPGFLGRVGVIHAMSKCFCTSCNRVRLTAVGDLKLCLFYDEGIALKPLLRGGMANEEIASAITQAVARKPLRHQGKKMGAAGAAASATSLIDRPCGMYRVGG
ncbi:GTP 3',8-cyclase MoaA [Ruminococcaceae bacterium OttesenSCG-928-A16]|nr:GTP 3',8-cyclase MoaA [Ruminococcaceae bacterium OttesenSCG-928-A16]